MKWILFLLVLTSGAYTEYSCPAVLDAIEKELPHYGVLKHEGDFVYVDLDDDYIHKLVQLIPNEGFQEPPYFGRADLVGAHISVIFPGECNVEEIQEYGQKIPFTIKECQVVRPLQMLGVDEVYLVVVDAPELAFIRKKYGLPKYKYDFHITIGVKPSYNSSAGTAQFSH